MVCVCLVFSVWFLKKFGKFDAGHGDVLRYVNNVPQPILLAISNSTLTARAVIVIDF